MCACYEWAPRYDCPFLPPARPSHQSPSLTWTVVSAKDDDGFGGFGVVNQNAGVAAPRAGSGLLRFGNSLGVQAPGGGYAVMASVAGGMSG